MKYRARIFSRAWFALTFEASAPIREKKLAAFAQVFVIALGMFLAISSPGLAQIDTGVVIGTVTDSSGAAFPNAKLTITNIDTGISKTATTDSHGNYEFNELRVGRYKLTAEASGFRRITVPEFTLLVDQRLRQNLVLQVGAVTNVVTVKASATMLTESSTIGSVIEAHQITQMPLNGRNYLQLAELSPSVLPIVPGTQSDGTQYYGRTDQVISVAGNRESDNGYYLDGVDTKNNWYGPTTLAPSVGAIEEFKIERTAFSVEFGNAASIINVTTKSGTNALHGSLYEFDRNSVFDARNFFNPGSLPPLRLNQFGGTIGGPIKKNKLFYFANYEGFREVQTQTGYGKYPTVAQRQGDFGSTTIKDPTTGLPYPNNTIPAADFSQVGTKFLQYLPLPNTTFEGDNYVAAERYTTSWDQVNSKLNYNISSNNSIFVRYSYAHDSLYNPGLAPLSGTDYPEQDQNVAGSWTHIFSPTTLNQLRVGYNRSYGGGVREGAYGANIATTVLGLKNSPTRPTIFGLPATSFTGYSGIGPGQTQTNLSNNWELANVLTMVRGRHTIIVGVEAHQQIWNLFQDSETDGFTFNDDYTGNSIANLLIGWPFGAHFAEGDPDGNFRAYSYAPFVEDDIQATPRLTFNLGLRYDYNQPSIDLQDHQEVFDWQTGEYIHPGTDGITRGIVFPDHREWGPRAGVAWRPFGQKTTVRASYGIYWLVPDWNMDQQKILTPDNYPKYVYTGTAAAPPMLLDDAFPAVTSASALVESGTTDDPYNRMPYVEQYGLTIEHQVSPNLLVEVGYDGSNSHHMVQRTPINPATPDPTGLIPLAQRVPYPLYSGGITANMEQGNATYNALTASVNKRFSGGVSFMAAYTYSKSMDDGTPDSEIDFPYNIKLNHAPSTFNVPQRLVMSWVYQLPIGRGRHFMTNPSSRLLDGFFGGWQVSGIATFDDGIGLTPGTAYAVNMGGRVPIVPNRIGPVNNAALRGNIRGLPGGVVGPYFNTGDIAAQVGNVQGDAGRDFIIAPGINNWDLSLFKSLRLGEQKSLQIRSDFFNAFNHTQFLPPNVTIGSSSFGYISGAREARDIQFSLKFLF